METTRMLQRQLGDIRIDRIIESEEADFDHRAFFPQTTAEQWEPHTPWLQPWAMHPASGNLIFPMQSFLLRTRHHTILVDTCVGDHKKRQRASWNMTSSGAYLKRFAATGVTPEQVEYVMCTHLHTDHVGWNTRLDNWRWVPTFPNAKYVMSEKEWTYWQTLHKETPQNQIEDSVIPIIESGQALLVRNDYAINDEIWFEPTPGHTPDHVSVRLASQGAQAVITGDMIHSPVQCAEPLWVARPDFDPAQAQQTRRAFLERYCDRDVLVCASHFPSPSFGRIVPDPRGFRFQYDERVG
jgi:glyoxylase-like metal-dependent hydrolase (beta-lactamase superfamily II)